MRSSGPAPALAEPAYSSSASATDAPSCPITPTVWQEGGLDAVGAASRPNVGIRPTSPQKEAGMRTLPPPSVPAVRALSQGNIFRQFRVLEKVSAASLQNVGSRPSSPQKGGRDAHAAADVGTYVERTQAKGFARASGYSDGHEPHVVKPEAMIL